MEHSTDHLHRLIRSMTGPEKRYFKVNTLHRSPSRGKEQIAMFDALSAMEWFDADEFEKLSKHTLSKDRISTAKHRLYNAILRSLSAYHTENSIDARIARSLHQVEILHAKALYAIAERQLASAKKLAQDHGRTLALLNVTRWEQRLMERGNYSGADAECVQGSVMTARANLLVEQELHDIWEVKSNLFMELYRDGQVRNADASASIERLLRHPSLQANMVQRSPRATFLYHHTLSAAAFAKGELKECGLHLENAHALLDRERPVFIEEPNLALSTMSNLIYAKVCVGRFTEAFDLLHTFRTLPQRWKMPESEDLDLKLFATTMSLELTIHTRMGEFEKALELLPVVERGIERYERHIGPMRKASLYYLMAYAHLGMGRPELAMRWTNRLLNDIHIDESAEIVSFGRMLDLIAHIDADDLGLLTYALRNTTRFLRTRKRVHRFEPLLLAMVRGVVKAPNAAARESLFRKFYEGVKPLENDPFEFAVFDHLDPIAWVGSKLTGRSFAEMVRERAHRSEIAA